MHERRIEVGLGLLAVAFFLTHGVYHLRFGFLANLLWACHLGALGVGIGLVLRSATLSGLGLLWLSTGTPLWLVGLGIGGTLVPTSLLTHLGGLGLGLWGARRLGLPRGLWWKAWALLVPLHVVSRGLAPPGRNVNLAHGVWPGYEDVFGSEASFLAAVGVALAAWFAAVEWLLRRASMRGDPSPRRSA